MAEGLPCHPLNLVNCLRDGSCTDQNRKDAARCLVVLCERAPVLAMRIALLEGGLLEHRHTDECFQYAARTARAHGNAYCIAKCADSWRSLKVDEGD